MRSGLRPLGFLALCAFLAACGGGATATATRAPSPTVPAIAAAPTAPAVLTPTASAVAATVTTTTGLPTTTATASPTRAPSGAPTAMPVVAGNMVMVELKDFAIALDTTVAKAGPVTFHVKNNGPSPHTFNVRVGNEEPGVKALDPGTVATVTLTLAPGTYTYRCMIPGHDLLGMKGTLTVQ